MSDALQNKLNKLSQAEQAMLRLISDPVLWVEATLRNPEPGKGDEPIKLRPYQANILRHPSKRRVCRMGRRCLAPGTPVLMGDGSWRPIEQIKVGEYVASRNKNGQLVPKQVTLEHNNGVKEIFRIRLSNGLYVDCTSNHPLLALVKAADGKHVKKDWCSIEDGLKVGMKVVTIKNYDRWGKIHDPELGALLGYLLTDGYIVGNGQTPKFTNNNPAMIEEVSRISKSLFDYDCVSRVKGNGWDIHITDGNRGTGNKLLEKLEELGLVGLKANNKVLPAIFEQWDKETILACINRMFAGDGGAHIHANGKNRTATELMLCSTSFAMMEQVRLVLLKIGVVARMAVENKLWKGESSVLYKLRIADCGSIENFFEHVGFIYGKEDACQRVLEAVQNKAKRRRAGGKRFQFVTIKSIESLGYSRTYDIGVKDTHNFIANGIVNHNTGKTSSMVMHIIWYAYTHRDSKQIIATPYQSQIDLIFDMIRQYIKSAPGLSSSIVRDIKNPSKIELSNGAIIRGFTAGTKNGDSGASLRGQAADWIYLDECVTGDTHVLTPDGEKFISDLKAGDMVLSYAQDGSLVERKILKMKCTGTKPVLRLHTSGDKVLICTANHPLLTSCGYQQAGLAKDVLTIDGLEYVLSISQESNQPVYNLTVEGEHNYIANGLITHNCDYMNDSDIETISAIALDRPSIGIWASSTPSGRRGMFWKMCTGVIKKKIRDEAGKIIGEESAWHEFYHPSTENPNWNEDMEAEFRAMFTEVAYEHEVLAEFGEETIGVFKKILIDAARAEYTYDQARLSPKMGPRIMGVDWDKYADASQAVILEYNQSAKQFMVIHRHETPKSAFTLTNAVSRIIELNEEYRLDYIFVDRGYGEYQVETLHKYGLDNPASGLHHKVRGVAFSEFKDIIDPHTKEIRSEPLKPFMVNTLLNILESYKLKISEYDEMIIRQMENYQVIKKTISGQPVYTSSDEHSLDCLMLCCLGFVEKYPEIIDDIFITRYANAIGRLSSDKDKEEKHPVQQAIDKIADEALAAIDVGKKPSVHKFNTRGTPRFRRTSF